MGCSEVWQGRLWDLAMSSSVPHWLLLKETQSIMVGWLGGWFGGVKYL